MDGARGVGASTVVVVLALVRRRVPRTVAGVSGTANATGAEGGVGSALFLTAVSCVCVCAPLSANAVVGAGGRRCLLRPEAAGVAATADVDEDVDWEGGGSDGSHCARGGSHCA